jgi:glutathione S-transferase
MLTLYQFPISHYCEKIRWALAYKGLNYRTRNLLPGLHVRQTRRLSDNPMVPILVHDVRVLQNSRDIISYLDETFPDHPLTPGDPEQRRQALEWEDYLDREIGIHLRRYCYSVLLEHPSVLIPFFTHRGPWYGPLLLRLGFPVLRQRMRRFLNIKEATAATSRKRLLRAVHRIGKHLQGRGYLVGEGFTRADLTAAALLGPLAMPTQYGLPWPASMPAEIDRLAQILATELQWVSELYAAHRSAVTP